MNIDIGTGVLEGRFSIAELNRIRFFVRLFNDVDPRERLPTVSRARRQRESVPLFRRWSR